MCGSGGNGSGITVGNASGCVNVHTSSSWYVVVVVVVVVVCGN